MNSRIRDNSEDYMEKHQTNYLAGLMCRLTCVFAVRICSEDPLTHIQEI